MKNVPTKNLLIVFIPAALIAIAAFTVRAMQYEPLYPSQEEIQEQQKNEQLDQIPILPNDPILGKRSAAKTIIAFEDLSCGKCKEQSELLNKLIEKHPNQVKVVWKSLPVKRVPFSSREAHEYAYCIHQQSKFKKFSEFAFANSNNLNSSILEQIAQKMKLNQEQLDSCLNSNKPSQYLQKNKQLATLLNVKSVPTFFIKNEQIKTPEVLSGWESLLELESTNSNE